MAVTRAAHGILGNIALRRKAARYAVEILPPCRDVQQQPVELLYLSHVRRTGSDSGLIVHDAQQVAPHERSNRLCTDDLGHLFCDLDGLELVGGEYHLEQLAVFRDYQLTAERVKAHLTELRLDKAQDRVRRCERRVTAQVDLTAGREPAQMIVFTLFDAERRLGEVILDSYLHHQLIVEPLIHNTHRRRISGKNLVGERVNNILLHENTSFTQRYYTPSPAD